MALGQNLRCEVIIVKQPITFRAAILGQQPDFGLEKLQEELSSAANRIRPFWGTTRTYGDPEDRG
jgi:hypothetical protein